MRTVILRCIVLLGVLAAISAYGRVLHVPAEYPQIQGAIDSSHNADTILVESGIYEEALLISNTSLTLIGSDAPDTVTGTGAIIDPENLQNSFQLACLTLEGGDSVMLENLWLKNGPAMHEGRATNDPGGISNENGPQLLSLKHCRFDSVHFGIRWGRVIVLDRVVMHDMQWLCITHDWTARITADRCRFEGAMEGGGVFAWSGSQFTSCAFANSLGGPLLTAGKDSLRITNCTFGPFQSLCGEAVIIRPGNGTVIEDNIFFDMVTGGIALEVIEGNCSTIVDISYQFPLIRNNVFRNIQASGSCQYGNALELKCLGGVAGFLGTVEGNVFENSQSQGNFANAIFVHEGAAHLINNRFENLLPNHAAAVYSYYVQSPETLLMRGNRFDSLEYAVRQATAGEVTDARWNWWGDSTGPYNSIWNPQGLGAEIDYDVMFIPWLTTPDSNGSDVDQPGLPTQPFSFEITTYPNPFNSSVRIDIAGFTGRDFNMKLFDTLGREVATLHSGPLQGGNLLFTAPSTIAAGVYFVRASDTKYSETKKIVFLK
ncbi:T9SS type A sorting domain-containing protein [bacterium]|nr:T9SS type A sorting domain-containing protein [bacterium]